MLYIVRHSLDLSQLGLTSFGHLEPARRSLVEMEATLGHQFSMDKVGKRMVYCQAHLLMSPPRWLHLFFLRPWKIDGL
jgi:hypothetical protein